MGKFKFMGHKFQVDPVDSPGPFRAAGPDLGKGGKPKKDTQGRVITHQGDLVWVNIYGAKGHLSGSTKAGGFVKVATDARLVIELGGKDLEFQKQDDPETGEELWTHLISQGKAK